MPNNLYFDDVYFWAHLTAAELRALRERYGDQICEPENLPAGHPDQTQRKVMDFAYQSLTGPQIAAILKEHGNWFVVIERSLYVSR